MMPAGGLYMIIHTTIIVIKKAINSIKAGIVPFFIILSVVMAISYGVALTVGGALEDSSNLAFIRNLVATCEPYRVEYHPKKIILRIDDIQSGFVRDTQLAILKELDSRKIPALLGVIPKQIEEDKKIYDYLMRHACHFEIAQHGYDHGQELGDYNIAEFGSLGEEEAYNRIQPGKVILDKLSGREIITFIPPNNVFSNGTRRALIKSGFRIISSFGNEIFDLTASTYDFVNDKLVEVDEVVRQCQAGLAKNDLCIIMLHPKDYTWRSKLDEEKYNNFIELIDELEKLDAMFTTTRELQCWYQLFP